MKKDDIDHFIYRLKSASGDEEKVDAVLDAIIALYEEKRAEAASAGVQTTQFDPRWIKITDDLNSWPKEGKAVSTFGDLGYRIMHHQRYAGWCDGCRVFPSHYVTHWQSLLPPVGTDSKEM